MRKIDKSILYISKDLNHRQLKQARQQDSRKSDNDIHMLT